LSLLFCNMSSFKNNTMSSNVTKSFSFSPQSLLSWTRSKSESDGAAKMSNNLIDLTDNNNQMVVTGMTITLKLGTHKDIVEIPTTHVDADALDFLRQRGVLLAQRVRQPDPMAASRFSVPIAIQHISFLYLQSRSASTTHYAVSMGLCVAKHVAISVGYVTIRKRLHS
jgi:hypothetical protein